MKTKLEHHCQEQKKLNSLVKPFEEFTKEANLKHNNAYTYCQKCYKGTNSKITAHCPQHGYFALDGTTHLRKTGCPECAYNNGYLLDLTYEKFKELLKEQYGEKYSIKREDFKIGENSKLFCHTHQQHFYKSPHFILKRGQGCKDCGKENKSFSYEDFILKSSEIHNNKYTYPQSLLYKNLLSMIDVKCPIHGVFIIQAKSHRYGIGCPKCSLIKKSKSLTKPYEDFLKDARRIHSDSFIYEEKNYLGMSLKMKITCKKHGEFIMTPGRHIRGQKCVTCSRKTSEGEKLIISLLNEMKIEYKREKTFSSLRSSKNGTPRFDFCIEGKKVLIEYDGDGHRQPIQVFGLSKKSATESFENVKRNDALKTTWAEENGWILLRYSSLKDVRERLIKELNSINNL